MSAENPFGVEQMALYFSTTAGAATPVAGNLIGEFRGEPTISDVSASAMWRGQNRVASYAVFHDRDVSMTIPGFSFDSSVAMAQLMNGTHTSASTLHGGAATAREDKVAVNSKPLDGEFLIEGLNTGDGFKFQILAHKAFITSVNPTIARTDFATMDVNLTLLADDSNDVWSIFHEF
jgi:hypothetical protein|tara:strand:- start:4022 stop:4552 length:531 start_codon:yes stop_codon:yes gene_type:complete